MHRIHRRVALPTSASFEMSSRLCAAPHKAAVCALAYIALSGCAGHVRYVSTYCVSQDQYAKLKSAEPGKIGSQLDGNAQHDLKLIAGNDLQLRTYSDGLLGVLNGCVDPTTEAPAK